MYETQYNSFQFRVRSCLVSRFVGDFFEGMDYGIVLLEFAALFDSSIGLAYTRYTPMELS